ncbi:NfeD family protein [Coprobacter secundus]|jgi:hypothetical protein|uniref:Nodulation efficiency protein D n=1 Tax=Coprobacter secundus subsp. similis TaxID=2751153 RepID=A0A7G1I193_9BACT|nr:NfeD family protein [Coprobacter secundus]BCI64441.1 nodulation efficiency protein D [Coprobacter secundus subsp. similis]CCY38438.1 putative uncharacterized protein [Tannerella sp. CAG:118]
MDILIIILLVLIGVVLIILEIFFLPGITVAGFSSLIFFGGGIYYAFVNLGTTAGYVTIAASVVACVVGIIWFMRSKSLDRISLKTDIDSVIPTQVNDSIKVGDEGIALSRLNPMGTVLIGTVQVEGKTREDFIDEGSSVIVERVERTSVIVRKKDD